MNKKLLMATGFAIEQPPEPGYKKALLTIGEGDWVAVGFISHDKFENESTTPKGKLEPRYGFNNLRVSEKLGTSSIRADRPFYYKGKKYSQNHSTDTEASRLYREWSGMIGKTVEVWLAPEGVTE